MKSKEVLIEIGLGVDQYPADACFSEGKNNWIGTYSEDNRAVCIMSEDNDGELTLDREMLLEIAEKTDLLITNMGCEVHSVAYKNMKLEIKKYPSQFE